MKMGTSRRSAVSAGYRVLAGLLSIMASGTSSLADTPSSVLEEVIVTAQRRTESSQDVGVTLAVVSGAELRDRNIVSSMELGSLTPSVTVSPFFGNSFPVITIRGVGFNNWQANNTSATAVHVDEVYMGSPALLGFQTYDIDRIEVLKGPQGTLYGRNTTAGTVNYVSAKPTADLQGYVNLSYGTFDTARIESALGGPLSSTLSGRLAFAYDVGDGYMKNRSTGKRMGGADVAGVRGLLSWRPSDSTEVLLNVHGGRDRSEPFPMTFGGSFCNGVLDLTQIGQYPDRRPECVNADGYSDPDGNALTGQYRKSLPYDNNAYGASVTADVKFDQFALRSITAYENSDRSTLMNLEAQPYRLLDQLFIEDFEQITQELRLSSNPGGRLDWILGVFLSQERLKFYRDAWLGLNIVLPPLGVPHETFLEYGNLDARQTTDSTAAFGDAHWHLNDQWSLVGGVRVTTETKSMPWVNRVTFDPSLARAGDSDTPLHTGNTLIDTTVRGDWDDVSGRAGLEWRPAEGKLYYLTFSRAFKSGGFNTGLLSQSVEEIAPFDPEILLSAELGAKLTLLDDTLLLNLAGYAYEYRDKQETVQIVDSSGTFLNIMANAGRVSIFGTEAEARWRVTSSLELNASVGWTQSEVEEWNLETSSDTNALGNVMPNSPELTANAGGHYDFSLPGGGVIRASVDTAYASSQYFTIFNEPYTKADARWISDASVQWRAPEGRLAVSLWGRNLSDETYRTFGVPLVGIGWSTYVYGQPRTFGARLEYKFN